MFWKRFQTPRRGVEHLRRPDLLRGPGDLQPDRVRKGLDPATGKNLAAAHEHRHLRVCSRTRGRYRPPLGFLLGYLGSVTSKEPDAVERYTELEVRALTGAARGGGGQALRTWGRERPDGPRWRVVRTAFRR